MVKVQRILGKTVICFVLLSLMVVQGNAQSDTNKLNQPPNKQAPNDDGSLVDREQTEKKGAADMPQEYEEDDYGENSEVTTANNEQDVYSKNESVKFTDNSAEGPTPSLQIYLELSTDLVPAETKQQRGDISAMEDEEAQTMITVTEKIQIERNNNSLGEDVQDISVSLLDEHTSTQIIIKNDSHVIDVTTPFSLEEQNNTQITEKDGTLGGENKTVRVVDYKHDNSTVSPFIDMIVRFIIDVNTE